MAENTQNSEKKEQEFHAGVGLAHLLKEYGVRIIFGIPDGHTLPFYDGILKTPELRHILVNDERTAIFAADAYARVTGTIGVCDAGSAGSMNFPVGISEAKGSGTPVLVIVGTVKAKDMLRNIPHDIDVVNCFKPITKWASGVYSAQQFPRMLNYALRVATEGKPGPVALVIPEDILNSVDFEKSDFEISLLGACSIRGCKSAPSESEILGAVDLIKKSKCPVIFSGGEAVDAHAEFEIQALAEKLQAPIFSTITGKGIEIENDQNMYFGTIGLFGEKPNHSFLRKNADLVIIIGNRLTEDDTANFKYPPSRINTIHIDLEPAEIGLNFKSWGVVGDPKAAVAMILEELKEYSLSEAELKERKENLQKLKEARIKNREKDKADWINSEPIKPQRVLYALSQIMKTEDFLCTDASSSSRWIGAYFPLKALGRKIITPRGVGPTGFGIGAVLGTGIAVEELFSSLEKTKRPHVVLFTGDGGLMNAGLSDLETIVNLGIDCLIVIINNRSLGYVKFGQAALFKKRYFQTDRVATPFVKISESFGAIGVQISKLSELDTTLKQLYEKPGLKIADILVDPSELLPPNSY